MVTHIIRKHLFPVLGLSLIKRKSFLIYFFLEKLDIVYTYPTTLSILSESRASVHCVFIKKDTRTHLYFLWMLFEK